MLGQMTPVGALGARPGAPGSDTFDLSLALDRSCSPEKVTECSDIRIYAEEIDPVSGLLSPKPMVPGTVLMASLKTR